MNKITRQTMLDFARSALDRGSIYVWGAEGETGSQITEAWIRKKETSTANATRAIDTWNRKKKTYDPARISAYDCSGLIQACINANGNPGWDDTADGLLRRCVAITKAQLQPGDFVFEWNGTKSGHVGVYVGNGKVIEARGRDYGVVETSLDNRNWKKYGRPDWLYAAVQPSQTVTPASGVPASIEKGTILKLTSPYMRGEDVYWLHDGLIYHHAMSEAERDGIFGPNTAERVKLFQAARILEGRDCGCPKGANGLQVPDGKVGIKTARILAERNG